jgi:Holliday junction resolvase-like predicted endonuclease
MPKIYVTKSSGERELYDRKKLVASLKRAKAHKKTIDSIVGEIEGTLYDGITTTEIYKEAHNILKNKENNSAIKYSIRRSLLNLGPSGFPFERFIAQIYEAKGYKVKVGDVLQGKCIKHEIDVMAYNDKELILIEVKFHNQLGIKSDTKVALYVNARFDDLRDKEFSIGGKKRKMTSAALITNTKFTHNSKRYMKCTGEIDMISFEYPSKGNLYQMIDETKVHPMTCVPLLTKKDKRNLMDKGIVDCYDLKNHKSLMESLGMPNSKINNIIKNIDNICSHQGEFK